jgi:hypothetical protein
VASFDAIIYEALANGLEFNFERMAGDAVMDSLDEFVDANREQLLMGVDSKGKSLGSYKSYGGESYKGTPLEPVNLYKEGYFHESIQAEGWDEVEIYATDSKTETLMKDFGEDILGVNLDAPTAVELLETLTRQAIYAIQIQINER